jgi:hypothetical protein
MAVPKMLMKIGDRVGRLELVEYYSSCAKTDTPTKWRCKCDCGAETVVRQSRLRMARRPTRSCGCLQRDQCRTNPNAVTHGARSRNNWLPEYSIWQNMRDACRNQNQYRYQFIGALGIKVCQRWNTSFADFIADVGRRPHPKATFRRIDKRKDYTPGNARWVMPSSPATR